jgi:hypothetical protein
MNTNPHKYAIGTQYLSAGKYPRLCTVTEQLTVANSKGVVVSTYYEATHQFLEQSVRDAHVYAVTIARGIDRLEKVAQ